MILIFVFEQKNILRRMTSANTTKLNIHSIYVIYLSLPYSGI